MTNLVITIHISQEYANALLDSICEYVEHGVQDPLSRFAELLDQALADSIPFPGEGKPGPGTERKFPERDDSA